LKLAIGSEITRRSRKTWRAFEKDEKMDRDSRIFVAGHQGLVGSAVVRTLRREGFENLLLRCRADVDLMDADATNQFFADTRPTHVIDAAARVGGIHANRTWPANFLEENLAIQSSLISAAHRHGVEKFLFLGSSCIYPKHAKQPISEAALLSGPLEETNQWYAIAKIAGIKLLQAYRRQYGFCGISAMPANLYGPGDNFDLETSHVLPALIRKFHEAKQSGAPEVTVWGSGAPRREFLHVDDLANACLHLMRHYDSEEAVNVGCGEDISIAELAALVKRLVGYHGGIVFDTSMPDGTPRKLLNIDRIVASGWHPSIPLEQGVVSTYQWYLDSLTNLEVTANAAATPKHPPDTPDAKAGPLEAILSKIDGWRRGGLRIGFTNGCFDILHPGHVSLMRQARAACDRLVVGLNSDASVRLLKGPSRPVQDEAARAAVLSAFTDVDALVVFDGETPERLIEAVRPDVLVKGADYTVETVVGADFVRKHGGEVLLARLEEGHSTTKTIARMTAP
jgi:GDP-L-fucose synthase